MKTMIILVCLVVANVQGIDVIRELLASTIEDCQAKTKATPEEIQDLLQHQSPTTTPGKCFVACSLKKLKILTADGAINAETTRDIAKLSLLISEEIYQKLSVIIDKCLGQVHEGDNECDVAYSIFTCAITEASAVKIPMVLGDLM